MEFYQVEPTLDNYWRAIILFGRNVASYKFAFAKALIDLNKKPNDLIKLEDLADKIDVWRQALDDEDLTDAADRIRDLMVDIESLGGGDLGAARSALSGEDDTERNKLRGKLTSVVIAAAPAADKFDEFMGD